VRPVAPQDAPRSAIVAADPLETVERAIAAGLEPVYACWDPDPETLDQPVLRRLAAQGPALTALGLEGAARELRTGSQAALGADCMAVALVDDGRDHLYLHYGRNIAARSGRDWTGLPLSQMMARSAASWLYGPIYNTVAAAGRPLYTENSNTPGLAVLTWRRLILPVKDGAGRVAGFVVANLSAPGLPAWSPVLPIRGRGTPADDRYRRARDRYNVACAIELNRGIEASAKALLGVGRVGVAIVTPDLGAFRYVGQHLAAMLGANATNFADRRPLDLLEDPAPLAAAARAMLDGADGQEAEGFVALDGGRRMYARLSFGRIDYNRGQGVALWITDLTEHRRLQDELSAARAGLEREHRARQRLWASLTHDIRTPINAILGFSESLEILPGFDEAKTREYAALIRRAGGILSKLVDDLLDLSRLEAGKYPLRRAPIDPAVPIAGAVEIIRPLAEAKRQALTVDLAAGLTVEADADALGRIALNLLSNAVKFTPNGGSISIALAAEAEGRTCLGVSDTGRGIAPEALARLQRPYEQAEGATDRLSGTGLGLSIVKALVDLHGGTLDIASRPGEGTIVRVILPP